MTRLNLGCNNYKIAGFINIDLDPNVKPDLVADLTKLTDHFSENSVDFIFAGHVLEHLPYQDSLMALKQCKHILRSHSIMLIVVPDYTKCQDVDVNLAEKIILANGDHKTLFNKDRLYRMIKESGFSYAYEVTDLKEVPYILVSNIRDPKPDPWQTAFIAFKTF